MDKPIVEVSYTEPKMPTSQDQRLENIWGVIKTVSTAPTHVPRKFDEQIVLYVSGVTYRLYIYDTNANVWRYATLT